MTTTSAAKQKRSLAIDTFYKLTGSLMDQFSGFKQVYQIRKLQLKDNWAARDIIHKALLQRGGVGIDQFYYDKELSDLHSHYNWSDTYFAVLTHKKEIIGTVGIRPVEEKPAQFSTNSCEIKKLHVSNKFPDSGHRERLVDFALKRAQEMGYSSFEMLVDDREYTLEKLLQNRGFESHKDAKYPGMKLMKYVQSENMLSKAS